MRLAIMQPYFFPYLGYFQLLNQVDEFVLYDNIQFTKRGWIHRNRVRVNDAPTYFSIPLKKDSDYLDVRERVVSETFQLEREKILRRIEQNYVNAPHFQEAFALFRRCIEQPERNLYRFIRYSLDEVTAYLGITTRIHTSSKLDIDHALKSQDKVLAICHALGAEEYVNPVGGRELYDPHDFRDAGVRLGFLESAIEPYDQGGLAYIPNLSVLDVLMWVSRENLPALLKQNRIDWPEAD